ncbi:EMILIN-2-like, partial [Saccostrea cucullata]|uniref:EMILIN-2-like n=1 Tax=Saccostrea cuccullata TaxID=36930 RepID=UPI002ED1AAE8
QTFALCGGQRGFIGCANGTKIRILSANYGRLDENICPTGNTKTRTCRSKMSEIKTKWNCNGYKTCHLHAAKQDFGDPCPTFSKYLEVKYHCIKDLNNYSKAKYIAFNAYITKRLQFPDSPVNVVYDGVYFNHGNAYNNHTGVFTTPADGLYVFTWSSLVAPKKLFDAEILVNGQRQGLGNCYNRQSKGYESCSNTVPLLLKIGDIINIRTTTADYLHEDWSSFKGWKV